MSSAPITIVVPYAEQESVFLLYAVKAALQVYRNNKLDEAKMELELIRRMATLPVNGS